jgi:hypothetical protein
MPVDAKTVTVSSLLDKYRALHDGISDLIEDGRLKESAIPDDYQWLVEHMAELAALDPLVGDPDPEDETIPGDLEDGTEDEEDSE